MFARMHGIYQDFKARTPCGGPPRRPCLKKPPARAKALLAFPCDFPIKIMGKTQAGFAQAIVEVVERHAPDFDPSTIEMRPSREGNYLSLTVHRERARRANSSTTLYRELCDHPMVTMVL